MAIKQLTQQFSMLSLFAKVGIGAAVLVVIGGLIWGGFGLASYFQDAAYQEREAERVEERERLKARRQKLKLKLSKQKGRIAELETVNETLKQVAASKRADTVQTVKEIEAVEKEHEARKQELEANGSTLSDDALRRELCERLRARGYKLTCSK